MVDPIIKHLPESSYEIITETYNDSKKAWLHNVTDDDFDVSFFSDVSQQHSLFLSHGIADKNYRNANKMKYFDFVGVSGELWKDKLINQGMDKNKILVVGYPKLDFIFQNRVKTNSSNGKINVLYAPTHNTRPENMNSTSTYPRFLNDLEFLKNDFNIKTAKHPANKENRNITLEDLNWADVVISDSGSLLYESLALDIPVVFPDYLVKNNIFKYLNNTFEEKIYKEGIGYHGNSIEEIRELIYKAYDEGLDKKTQDFIEGIFPKELRGKSGKVIADILRELVL